MADSWILTLTCPDRVGIVAAITGSLARHDGFILDSQQYADLESRRFFMRLAFQPGGPRFPPDEASLRATLNPVADQFRFSWSLTPSTARPRVVIAVSQASHCLNDLLHRWHTGTLPIDIVAVASNHESTRKLSEWHGVPYHHLPVSETNRRQQEDRIGQLMSGADLLVLARYMQVLSSSLLEELPARCINIHHSFLPGFKGAKPYHRAHDRGVKLIGATAHFVTERLDEGPIIEQAVERVDHRSTVEDMIRIGRDIEAQVLARAVRWYAERRVLLNGAKTVIFR